MQRTVDTLFALSQAERRRGEALAVRAALHPPRLGELLAGLFGAGLVASLFLPWYQGASGPVSGWQALTAVDVVVLLAGSMAVALVVLEVTQPTPAITIAWAAIVVLVSLIALVLVGYRTILPPAAGLERELVYVALGAAAALVGAGLLCIRDEGTDFWPGVEEPRGEGPAA